MWQRVLEPHSAAVDCLQAVGFVHGKDAEDNPLLVIGSAEPAALQLAGDEALRRVDLLKQWPAELHASLPAACEALADSPETLSELTSELSAAHVPSLLAHEDNSARVASQLMSAETAGLLIEQLRELRANITAEAGASGDAAASSGGDAAGGAASGASRVRRCTNPEEWYDALLEAKGLVVVDFGAEWCKPCQHVKPLFDELSRKEAYRDVTFLTIDADENPVIIGENSISAFPTFKFFLNSAEEDLPIVGADIIDVQAKLDELLAGMKPAAAAA